MHLSHIEIATGRSTRYLYMYICKRFFDVKRFRNEFFQSRCYYIKGWQWQRATITTCEIFFTRCNYFPLVARIRKRDRERKRRRRAHRRIDAKLITFLCERYFQRISIVTCHAKKKSIFINTSIPRLSVKKTQSPTKPKINCTNRYLQSLFCESVFYEYEQ